MARGWFVVPSYDYTGAEEEKAPRLQGLAEEFVIPDLDVCRNGVRKWIEVKTKGKPSPTRMTQRQEHGIAKRHWNSYWRVQEISGTEVWLAIYE